MSKPLIAVFSGPNATIANSPPLVTSNKGRLEGERKLEGRYDNLVPQLLYESVKVKIKKFSAHPLEIDSKEVYQDDGRDYYEVTLSPQDGPYLLPYLARRKDGSEKGTPFEASDMWNPAIKFGGRQFFYPDASRIFEEIDRSIYGKGPEGEGNTLDRKANYAFVRVLPPAGYATKGEVPGVDYFPYRPEPIAKIIRAGDLATAANIVQATFLDKEKDYDGGIWLDGSPQLEESLYWLNLLVDTERPIVGVAAQRPHGETSADGDRNIIDAVDYIVSGCGKDLGAVGISDQVIFASREFKKADARPGNYKATGGHGGILGSIKNGVTIWYKPTYKHTHNSDVNLGKLPNEVQLSDGTIFKTRDQMGKLIPQAIPRVRIVKYASYSQEDEKDDPRRELDVMAWTERALEEQKRVGPKLFGLVFEGLSPYAVGGPAHLRALWFASASGLPVVRTGRSDPGGRVITEPNDLTIEGSNLDSTKARLLLIASMLKLGALPRAADPSNPTNDEVKSIIAKVSEYQGIFENH